MHRPRALRVLIVLCWGQVLIACGDETSPAIQRAPENPPTGTALLPGGEHHWDDWLELVPAIRTPRTASRSDETRIYAKFPPGRPIELADPNDRNSLRVPEGAILDRVESRRARNHPMRVVDVRGTEFGAAGRETFRAYRAMQSTGDLFGVEWARTESHDFDRARDAMRDAMRSGVGYISPGGDRAALSERYQRLMACAGCHTYRRPERYLGEDTQGPRRTTDASGLYSLIATLSDESILETYRPHDANSERPIALRCRDDSSPASGATSPWPHCADGSVPIARLDVRRGLEIADPDTLALCESRRALMEHLSRVVRAAYANELTECGVEVRSALRISRDTLAAN